MTAHTAARRRDRPRGAALPAGLRLARRAHRARDRRHLPADLAASRSAPAWSCSPAPRPRWSRSTTCTSSHEKRRSRTSRSRRRSCASSWCSCCCPTWGRSPRLITTAIEPGTSARALTSPGALVAPRHSLLPHRSSLLGCARAGAAPGPRHGPGLLADRAHGATVTARAISPGTSGSPTSSSPAAPTSAPRSRPPHGGAPDKRRRRRSTGPPGLLQRRPGARHARGARGLRRRASAPAPSWLFLTGPRDAVAALLRDGFQRRLRRRRAPRPRRSPTATASCSSTAQLRIRGYYHGNDPATSRGWSPTPAGCATIPRR